MRLCKQCRVAVDAHLKRCPLCLEAIEADPPLVEGYLNLDDQVQANGFDLSLRDIGVMQTGGQVAADNAGRVRDPEQRD